MKVGIDYIAGLFDGDGNFSFTASHGQCHGYDCWRVYYRARLGLRDDEVNATTLESVASFLRGKGVGCHVTHQPRANQSYPIVELRIAGRSHVKKFCRLLDGRCLIKESQRKALERIVDIIPLGVKSNERKDIKYKRYLRMAKIWDKSYRPHARDTSLELKVKKIREELKR